MIPQELDWASPLAAAAALTHDGEAFALLYSGLQLPHSGGVSYLALTPQAEVKGNAFADLAEKLSADGPMLGNAWFGYFGYEMLHDVESLPRAKQGYITLPDLWFARFGTILRFDHAAKTVTCFGDVPTWPPQEKEPQEKEWADAVTVASLSSPMSRMEYLAAVHTTREAILRGDFYEANITRKFTGEFAHAPDALALFAALHEASPAAYSALLHTGEAYILSSSPERFLTVDAGGAMQTRPIKGTAPLDLPAEALAASEKDRAENLMIVDLMRNDLSRSAQDGSVRTEKLFEIASYATLHHMESTVTAQKRSGVTTLEAVRRAFPPGSMTGAPKIRAMEWCMEKERIRRGVYSGALGWFGGDGSCDLSVVIRTLVIEGKRFEFQAGGAIVADSEPEAEWQEVLTKCRGIAKALGLDVTELENI